jgi:hypothetical protein
MNEPTSAIVVRIGLPPALEAVRRRFDQAAELKVPAHVTLLYPWLPAEALNRAARRVLAAIVRETRGFDVRFAATRRWPGILYLEPEPAWRFGAIIENVSAGFPEYPPYGGTISEVIPHLTLVENATVQLDPIEAAVARHLPFERTVRSIEVLLEGPDGRWRTRWRLPLSADSSRRPSRTSRTTVRRLSARDARPMRAGGDR